MLKCNDLIYIMSKALTLADFIEANYRLISALGVFTALTIYARSLNSGLGDFLLGVFTIQAILIWFEIYMKIPIDTKAFSTISFFQTTLILPFSYLIFDVFKNGTLIGRICVGLFFLILIIFIVLIVRKRKKDKSKN